MGPISRNHELTEPAGRARAVNPLRLLKLIVGLNRFDKRALHNRETMRAH